MKGTTDDAVHARFRYSADVDVLRVYFAKEIKRGKLPASTTIRNTEPIHTGLLVDYDAEDRVVAFEIGTASRRLPDGFFERLGSGEESACDDDTLPLLPTRYNPVKDNVAVCFETEKDIFTRNSHKPRRRLEKTADERITLGTSGNGLVWRVVYVRAAHIGTYRHPTSNIK